MEYLGNGDEGETLRRLSDIIFHNNCFYSNLNEGAKYTAILDIDEVGERKRDYSD